MSTMSTLVAVNTTKAELLRRMRSYVEATAKRKKVEPWVIVKDIFGHGSGVSSALYEVYIKEKD